MTGVKYSEGLVFRVVKSTELYYITDNNMVVEGKTRSIDNFNGVIGFNM